MNVNKLNKNEKRFDISEEKHVVQAAAGAKQLAKATGFALAGQYTVSTTVSELARNIFRFAKNGQIVLSVLDADNKKGIEVVAEDNGPGITDLTSAMTDGFSTLDNSLGVGLPGVKRMMDEFEIESKTGVGTKITVRKWIKR